jgi:crossover junction endodeoxyribonuclease RuvC
MVADLVRRERSAGRAAEGPDALALAICQIWRGGAQNRLQQAHAAAQRKESLR